MIGIVYVVLAISLAWAARNPVRHIMIIWFAIILSILHGGVMAVLVLTN